MDEIEQERKRKREQALLEYQEIVSYEIAPVPSAASNPKHRGRRRRRFKLRYFLVPFAILLTFTCYYYVGKLLSETNAVNQALHQELTEKHEQLESMQDELLSHSEASASQEASKPPVLETDSVIAAEEPSNAETVRPQFSVNYPLLGSSTILHSYGSYTNSDGTPEFCPGLDLGTPGITDVVAAGDGTVLFAGQDEVTGGTIQIDHGNGYISYYCYTESVKVVSGQPVKAGQIIASTGNPEEGEASHMEFRIMYDGSFINPEEVLEIKG